MARISDDLVRQLAGFRGESAPVTSCYLDVDGSRYVRPYDYELHLDRMIRDVSERRSMKRQHGASAASSLRADLGRIEEWVKAGLDRARTRGLAIFSCTAHDLWHVLELPVPVRNQLVIGTTPHVRQLEAVIEEYERFAVLLVDRQRARLLVFELGELVERKEQFDRLPRHEDDGGEHSRDRVRGHVDAVAHQHLRRAAQAAFSVFQDEAFHHLIVCAPESLTGDLERELHPYLRDRIAARRSMPVHARDDEIRRVALEVQGDVERAKETAAVNRLRDVAGAGNGGAIGLEPVLRALVERRVETLLVSDGFEAPGWRCPDCGYVGVKGRRCPVCRASMRTVDDVVEEAVDEALGQSCRVEVCRQNPDLDVLGGIGALLRF